MHLIVGAFQALHAPRAACVAKATEITANAGATLI